MLKEIQNYPELNSVKHIYQEWIQMLDPPKIDSSTNVLSESSGVPTFSEAKFAIKGIISQMEGIIKQKGRPAELLSKISQLWNIIFDYLDFYGTIPVLPSVISKTNNHDTKLIHALEILDQSMVNCFSKLNQLKVYSDFLA